MYKFKITDVPQPLGAKTEVINNVSGGDSFIDTDGNKVHVFNYYHRVPDFLNTKVTYRNDEGTEVQYVLKSRRGVTYVY